VTSAGEGSEFWNGTRFRLFAQAPFLDGFHQPEIVTVSSPAGSVGPGPADERMYVVDPIGKARAYGLAQNLRGDPLYLMPPWRGDIFPPALPDAYGHFDYIEPEDPEFESAHLFGSVRFTLDVWEKYFGHPITWHFQRDLDRLELVIQRNLMENAFMGYGFLEVGIHETPDGWVEPFTLNFDVVSHEVGHCIIYSVIGVPDPGTASAEYYGFHESSADLSALITALHFDSVIDELLETSHGNLYTRNLVNRIAELSANSQIRLAANPLSMLDFVHGWSDEHALAQPLTGAMFDILVDLFHEELVARGLITHSQEDLSDRLEDSPDYFRVIQPMFDEAYAAAPLAFREALVASRDELGMLLAETWRRLSSEDLSYAEVGNTLRAVDRLMAGGRWRKIIDVNLNRRAIGFVSAGPKIKPFGPKSHFGLPRVFVPGRRDACCARHWRVARHRGAGNRVSAL